VTALAVVLWTEAAPAYIGPGAGFALVSSFLTFFVAFFAAFFALLTFPVRMTVKKRKRRRAMGKARVERAILLGLDGLDPLICEEMMDRGELPHFRKLRDEGTFRRLGTSVPAMSPVAWSSFATGSDASRHGIFDFLGRDPRTYAPVLSSTQIEASTRFLKLGSFAVPWRRRGGIRLLRRSQSFWKILGDHGIFSAVLRVPITFPPEKFDGVMLSGMCVPDLRGTQGSFTYFTEETREEETIGGMVVPLVRRGESLEAAVPGPASPIDGRTLTVPLKIRPLEGGRAAEVTVGEETFRLEPGRYSPWIRLKFRAALGLTLSGIVRFALTRLDGSVGLYMSPIHIDPERPTMPISHPNVYAVYLAKKFGLYGTLGLAEDTWAINERVLDEAAFLEQAYLFHQERRRMFFDALEKLRTGAVVCVFDLSDRLQHVFFRYLSPNHPANRGKDTERFRDALFEMYREMDRLVGETLDYVDDRTLLIVMSDHGFKSFEVGVDLNAWLRQQGLLVLRDEGPNEYLQRVDWERTRAYAVGLGGIYLNRKGRERRGIVGAEEADTLKARIAEGLLELRHTDGRPLVRRVYDVQRHFSGPYRGDGPDLIVGFAEGVRVSWDCARGKVTDRVVEPNERSWSGDHCMDPEIVPGVFFSNRRFETPDPSIQDIAPTVLDHFGVSPPRFMTGRVLR
jgi:predicted AlkP superfamily phosphohydrolase/phosphomutase